MSTRPLLTASICVIFATSCASQAPALVTTTWTKESQQSLSPDQVLARLREGHDRFKSHTHSHFDYGSQAQSTAHGQYPIATILSCIDSRAPVEPLFDVGIGEVFSARVAGVVIDEDVLGSLEYTVKYAGSKVIVVMAHTSCGAVKGAVDGVTDGHIGALVAKLAPAVAATHVPGEHSSHNHELVDGVARSQVYTAIEDMRAKSAIIREMADNHTIRIVGALYHLDTATLEFLEPR